MHIVGGLLLLVILAFAVTNPRLFGVILLVGIAGIVVFFYQIFATESARNEAAQKVLSQMRLAVSYDTNSCTNTAPILVRFENGSDESVYSFRFLVAAQARGYSSEIFSNTIATDKIVAPRTTYAACFGVGDVQPSHGQQPKDFYWYYRDARVDFH